MDISNEMLAYSKEFVAALGECLKKSGERAKELGLTRKQTLHVWRRTLEITLKGGGSTKEI